MPGADLIFTHKIKTESRIHNHGRQGHEPHQSIDPDDARFAIIDVWRLGQGRDDVIGLWAGESDLPTPKAYSDAAAGTGRGPYLLLAEPAFPLRAAIAGYYERLCGVRLDDERIAATCAGMNAVMLVAQAIVEPGDNVVCVTPSWPNILRAITITGGEAREVALDHDDSGWHLDLQRLFDACDGRTRAIYYASPGNPTGWMLEDAQQRELLAWRGRGIAIIADEVYQRIVYDRPTRRPSWKSPRRTTPCSWSTASPSPGP